MKCLIYKTSSSSIERNKITTKLEGKVSCHNQSDYALLQSVLFCIMLYCSIVLTAHISDWRWLLQRSSHLNLQSKGAKLSRINYWSLFFSLKKWQNVLIFWSAWSTKLPLHQWKQNYKKVKGKYLSTKKGWLRFNSQTIQRSKIHDN